MKAMTPGHSPCFRDCTEGWGCLCWGQQKVPPCLTVGVCWWLCRCALSLPGLPTWEVGSHLSEGRQRRRGRVSWAGAV